MFIFQHEELDDKIKHKCTFKLNNSSLEEMAMKAAAASSFHGLILQELARQYKVHLDVLVCPEVEGQTGDDLTQHTALLFRFY